jgi:hypothetical protein
MVIDFNAHARATLVLLPTGKQNQQAWHRNTYIVYHVFKKDCTCAMTGVSFFCVFCFPWILRELVDSKPT